MRMNGQRGAALFMSLIILLVMTILGVTSMKNTVLEERMAGGLRDRSLAFQAAEAALRDGEKFLTSAALPVFNDSAGLYQATTPPKWETIDWNSSTAVASYTGPTLSGLAATPAYIIEELPPVTDSTGSLEAGIPQEIRYYRVTARSVGQSTNAVVMVQSIYKR